MGKYTYSQLNLAASDSVLFVTFVKRDSSIRHMACTRDLGLIASIDANAVDKIGNTSRCNAETGLLSVFDLVIDELRTFNVDRVLDVVSVGRVRKDENLDKAIMAFTRYVEASKFKDGINMENVQGVE